MLRGRRWLSKATEARAGGGGAGGGMGKLPRGASHSCYLFRAGALGHQGTSGRRGCMRARWGSPPWGAPPLMLPVPHWLFVSTGAGAGSGGAGGGKVGNPTWRHSTDAPCSAQAVCGHQGMGGWCGVGTRRENERKVSTIDTDNNEQKLRGPVRGSPGMTEDPRNSCGSLVRGLLGFPGVPRLIWGISGSRGDPGIPLMGLPRIARDFEDPRDPVRPG